MLVRDHMSSPAVTIRTNADYKAALRLMQEKSMHHLPVVDQDGELVGIAAERDLLLAAMHYMQSMVEVGDVMHRGAITATPDMPIVDAADLMMKNNIGGLPVVDGGQHLLGIITETDIFKVLASALRRARYE
jgi:acetoin utilization protein AcuB